MNISHFLTICLILATIQQVARSQEPPGMQLVLLGTGTPNADPDRSGPAVAVVVDDFPYLVDFGPGVVRRAAAGHRAGIEGLAVEKLTTAFLTHLHSDHTVGYADLIFTPWVLDRRKPLFVFGPAGLQEMTDHILAAYREDIAMRLYGLEPRDDVGYKVHITEIDSGFVYEDERVRVTAFAVPHASWPNAFGYKFEGQGRTIVISGDTAPSDAVVEACNRCDILVHEVYSASKFQGRHPAWQAYHRSSHTSTVELAELANRAKPELLVLYHQLFWGASEEELLEEVRALYDGKVVSGKDLDVY